MPITKSLDVTILAHQTLGNNQDVIGVFDLGANAVSASLYFWMGRTSGTAFTPNGARFRVEASATASGDADWAALGGGLIDSQVGASIAVPTVTGTVNPPATVIPVSSVANLSIGQLIYIKNTTLANSEWARILSVGASDITIEEPIRLAQTGSTVYGQAEVFTILGIECTSVRRLRVVSVNNCGVSFDLKVKGTVGVAA